MEGCHTLYCFAENGNWGLWSEWSSCDATCGGGSRSRERLCDSPAPDKGGKFCLGFGLEVAHCNSVVCKGDFVLKECPQAHLVMLFSLLENGNWGNWGKWSTCSRTCEEGIKMRERSCDSSLPQHDGAVCDGEAFDTTSCDMGQCPSMPFGSNFFGC